MLGGNGDDTLTASGGTGITLFGGSGSALLTSTDANNVSMLGGSGDDTLSASNGTNVTLFGGSGSALLTSDNSNNVSMLGGGGDDTLTASGGTQITLFGSTGNDLLQASGVTQAVLAAGSGDTHLVVHDSTEVTLFGGSGNSTLTADNSNNVSMLGGTGNDTLTASTGTGITLFGGNGNALLTSDNANNVTLLGGTGNDTLTASAGTDVTLFGGSGNDSLQAAGGSDLLLIGGSGDDTLAASGGTNVTLFGGSGSALLTSDNANNVSMLGGGGDDTLTASGGTDVTLFGGSGSALLTSDNGNNVSMLGGSGDDTLSASNGTNVTLFGGSGSALLTSDNSNNVSMLGGSGDDTLTASGGTNVTLFGGSGSALLTSDNGNNVSMLGGSGDDTLAASGGTDVTLFGGSGNDSLQAVGGSDLVLVGGSGNSRLDVSGSTGVTLFGGSGSNTLTATNSNNVSMVGGSGGDTLTASGGTDVTLFGGDGSDALASSNVASLLMTGGAGRDTLTSVHDTDAALTAGGRSSDRLAVTDGTRVAVVGGGGDDTLSASGGTGIRLSGLDGNNLYQLTGTPADPLDVALNDLGTFGSTVVSDDGTSDGINTVAFPGVASGITLDLSDASLGPTPGPQQQQQVAPGLTLSLTGYFQNVVGTAGANSIKGDPAANVLQGQGGNDTLLGGSGPATLVAGNGGDVLMGGTGGTTYRFAGTGLGSVTVAPASDASDDTLDFSQLGGAVTLDLTSAAAQPVSPAAGLTLTVSRPLGITGVVDTPFNDTITGNTRDDSFTVQGGNDTFTGGGGNDTYLFGAGSRGAKILNETATANNTLDFHAFDGPVNLDLTQAGPQAVSPGNLTLTLAPPAAFDRVIGSRFADAVVGNDRGDTLIGGGGGDRITSGSGADLIQGGITQVVYLNFDAGAQPGYHVYTLDERAAVQAGLEAIYKNFAFVFTQDPAQAAQLAQLTGGQFATLNFNVGPYPGASHELDTENLDLGGFATINVNPALGSDPGLVPDTSPDVVGLTATIAAHELGHLVGLEHGDAFGPVGTGIYAGVAPAQFFPVYPGTFGAVDTPSDVMASPASVNSPLIDAAGPTQLGERDALHLAFNDNGTLLRAQDLTGQVRPVSGVPGVTSAVALGELPQLAVPNPLLDPGSVGYGQTFQAAALGVLGTIAAPGQEDFYAIPGHAGEVMSFEVTAEDNTLNPRPFPPELEVLDGTGHTLGYNVHNFESADPMILDLTLPADGTYYVGVDAFGEQATGDYRLLMYSLSAVNGGAPQGNGVTVYGGGGNDTLVGSSGDDSFIYLPGAVGQVTIQASSGADVLDLRSAPRVSYTLIGDPTLGTLTVPQNSTTTTISSDHPSGSTYGQAVTFTATVSAAITPTGSVQFQIDGVNYGAPITLTGGTASFSTSALPAGNHTIGAVYTSDSASFVNASGSSSASVSPAVLTVRADDQSMVYGGTLPALTLSYGGFVNGESASVLSGSASLSTTATASSGADTYAISVTQGTLSAANYTFSFVNGTLTIARATPSVAVTAAGGTYNGQPYPATATVAGVVPGVDSTPAASLEGVSPTFTYYAGSTASGTPLVGAPTGAGTYTVVASFAGSADYTAASDSTTFTIAHATPTVAVTDQGGIYTGQAYPATATVAGVVAGVDSTPAASLEGVAPTHAYYAGSTVSGTALSGPPSLRGTYTVVTSFAGSADYRTASASTTFTIAPAMPSLAVTDTGGIYNGQPYPATATVAGVVSGVDDTPGPSLEGVSVSLSYYAGSTAGGTPLSGAPSLAGTYTALVSFAGSADYVAGSASTTFTITPATPSVTVADAGGTYNRLPYPATATVAGVVAGVDNTPAASLEGVALTLAYYAGSTAGGTALTSPPVVAGTYTVVASFAGSADYAAASARITYVIGLAAPTISVSDAGGIYNGQPYPATATVAGVVPGVDTTPAASLEGVGLNLSYYAGSSASGSPLAGAPSGAGTYTVMASFAGSADYAAATAAVTFTLNPAMPTVAVNDAGGTFTGQPYSATATVAGVVPGVDTTPAPSLEGVTPTLAYYAGNTDTGTPLPGAPSAVGTYTVVASFAGSADYTAASASALFVILPSGGKTTPTIAVTDAGGTYDGQPFPATATITGANGQPGSSLEGVSLVLTYYAGTHARGTPLAGAPSSAGAYTVLAAFAGSPDYNPARLSTTFVIARAAAKVVVTDAGGTYNAQPFPATATVAGVNGTAGPSLEGVSPTLSYYAQGSTTKHSGAPTAAGSYTVVASFAGSADYMPTSNTTTFTIAQAMPTVAAIDAGGTYNGKPFPATATVAGVTGIPAAGLQGVRPSLAYYALGSGGTKTLLSGAPNLAGNYEVDATFAGSADYVSATVFTTFNITVATPKVVVHDQGGIFNGQPFPATATVAGVGVPASGSLEGVSLVLTYYAGLTPLASAPITAGSYTVVASFPGSADYAAVSVSTTFTIARAAPKLTVSDPGGTYNGQPFAGTATVVGVDNTPSASLEGVSPSLLYYLLNSDGTKTALSGAPLTPGRYEVDAVFAGSVDYAAATRSTAFRIKKSTPAFSALSSPVIALGTDSVLLSGRISLGGLIPAGLVTIMIDGVSVTAQIHADGSFSASFDTAALRAGKHTITYSFAGDEDFRAMSGKGTLTVTL
jgi:Ca2+-binding RTX toxin-like protein